MKVAVLLLLLLASAALGQADWQANLDSKIVHYQPTDFGIVLAGTERSLYAIDGTTGERIWRRETGRTSETSVTIIPDTDLLLFSRDLGSKSLVEAVDILTGRTVWQSDKMKGDVMQLAADPSLDLLAAVVVRNAKGKIGESIKRTPTVHVIKLSEGDEIWKRELDGDIEMMPARFGENLGEVDFTLDNYRAPLLLDGRLFLFYEGATSLDARTGKEKEREKFKINEDGLALTEADPVFDDTHVFVSGRGRIRAVNRRTGNVDWKADDVGNCAEMARVGSILYVRTGGQFTRIKDGEPEQKGPYGVSAIDSQSGKVLWRFKGADKGLTNFVFLDANTILVADRDDLISIDAATGKRRDKIEHKIEKAQFVLINESGAPVVGGRDEIAAMRFGGKGSDVWRVRHNAPSRGVLRVVAGIALRAAAIYFRYGGVATSALGFARGGLNLVSVAKSLRWSGLKSRLGSFDLTTIASNAAQNYVTRRIYSYGSLASTPSLIGRIQGLEIAVPDVRGRVLGSITNRITPSRTEVRESIFDRLDPIRQAEKLSSYLLRRKRLAELRANHMYFYTDLEKPFDRKGLVGVNIHTGRDSRFALVPDPDPQFTTDETTDLLYSANGSRLQAFGIMGNR
ncbi:MAG: PQQ-binding-like beta-propeller repeat protein [Blastocatellia bacterium]|nr:PQQ-binding-like beta-propeller repeat protein [Blastocatellia bacterium]